MRIDNIPAILPRLRGPKTNQSNDAPAFQGPHPTRDRGSLFLIAEALRLFPPTLKGGQQGHMRRKGARWDGVSPTRTPHPRTPLGPPRTSSLDRTQARKGSKGRGSAESTYNHQFVFR